MLPPNLKRGSKLNCKVGVNMAHADKEKEKLYKARKLANWKEQHSQLNIWVKKDILAEFRAILADDKITATDFINAAIEQFVEVRSSKNPLKR